MENSNRFCFISSVLQTCAALMLTAVLAGAQVSRVGAGLEGTVSDSSGGRIPGIEVRLQNAGTHQLRAVAADENGFFRAAELPVGTYEVFVESPGFAPYRHVGLILQVGETVHLSIVLQPASITSEVTVTAQPPPLDPTQTSLTSTVDKERIEELPVVSRNYLNFVLLSPGVAGSAQQTGTQAQTPLADSGFTFGGLRARSNNISIDGLDNNDEFTGSSRTELSLEIVQEFQVVNNGISAESGGASGGSINVVTKTGSNAIHGDAFIFLQNGSLNARDPFENEPSKPDLQKYRAGFSLGGPIVKDRTFYYTGFEQEHNRGEGGSLIDETAASVINRRLAAGAFPGLKTRQIDSGFVPFARAETEAAGKLSHQLSPAHSLMLRYAFTNNRESGDAFNTGGLVDGSSRGSSFIEDHALVGSLASIFGSQGVGDLRFQIATRQVVLRTNDAQGPGIDIPGLLSFGRPFEGNSSRREKHYQLSYTFSRNHGEHLWKFGATANRVRLRATTPDGFGGLYSFGSLDDFLAGRPDLFRGAAGDAGTDYPVMSWGAFVQDHWSPLPKLTLDTGLRYDFEHLPSGMNQDTNNFGPRFGLAYSPGKRWVLRAGYGIFYDRYVLANLNRAIDKDGVRALELVAEGNEATQIFRSSVIGMMGIPTPVIAPSGFRIDPQLAASYSQQASFAAEYLLSSNLTVNASYLWVRGTKLSRTRNINLPQSVILTAQNAASLGIPNPTPQQIGRSVFGVDRQFPRYDAVFQLENSANSSYQGLTVSLNRRFADEFEFSASYTVSKAFDDASDFNEQPQDPYHLGAEWALSRQHQQQRFVLNALWDLPIGDEEDNRQARKPTFLEEVLGHIEVAPILSVVSGRPENPLTGLDWNRSRAFPLSGRPAGFGRNAMNMPGCTTLDLRVLKFVPFGDSRRLDFVAEFFNFFNHPNINQINSVFGMGASPISGFGKAVAGAGARQIQFSLDFEF